MNPFDELGTIATRQCEDGDFPTWLLAEVMIIANNQDLYGDRVQLIETLTAQISNFDLFAGTGCFDTAVGTETIRSTIRQIKT